MEAITACSVRVITGGGSCLPLSLPSRSRRFVRRSSRIPVIRATSKDGPELDKWDLMELKFGRLLGEDPKLTLAKIMARKSNPDVSYLDVEKSFYKNKGKLDDYRINIPLDVKMDELPLVPPKKADTSKPNNASNVLERKINLSRPTMKGVRAVKSSEKLIPIQVQPNQIIENATDKIGADKVGAPNISLRKPSIAQDDDIEMNSKFKPKPNLFLKMRQKSGEDLSNLSLLKKPVVVKPPLEPEIESAHSGDSFQASIPEMRAPDTDVKFINDKVIINDANLTRTVESSDELQLTSLAEYSNASVSLENDVIEDQFDDNGDVSSGPSNPVDGLLAGLQPPNQSTSEDSFANVYHDSANSISSQAALLGKPQRLETSIKGTSRPFIGEKGPQQQDDRDLAGGTDTVLSTSQEEIEESDWKKAEHLVHSGDKAEVELISCSSRGFVASFGSLIGFLPYRNLGARWKFLAFESWLRKNGVDPSLYRQNLSIVGNYDVSNEVVGQKFTVSEESNQNAGTPPPEVKFQELLKAYDLEKTKFLSSFIGQRLKVSVILADRNSRKIMFSVKPKEKKELIEKKRALMARLNIGDIVKCCINKITYFGIFVEVEGVPALIHQSEVSWDTTLDPSSHFKIGQMVEAKVHQLDYALERIMLSLRDVTPDPEMEALESVVGDRASLDGRLEVSLADVQWVDVDLLVKELQKIDGITSVSRGRFFKSSGLAPTFQVYMASMFENKYKLLARYENKVQEIMVESSLDKEQMKAAIVTCTSKVSAEGRLS